MAKISKTDERLHQLSSHILGRMLVVDPSSASKDSKPGFAICQGGKVITSGIFNIPHTLAYHLKLREIAAHCAALGKFDLLVVEMIPPFMGQGDTAGGFRNRQVIKLHHSVAVIMASTDATECMELPIQTWKSWVTKHHPDYVKSDEEDALMMARCILSKVGGNHVK